MKVRWLFTSWAWVIGFWVAYGICYLLFSLIKLPTEDMLIFLLIAFCGGLYAEIKEVEGKIK